MTKEVVGTPDILHQDICEQAYTQVEKMIHKICWEFHLRYGGEIDEWVSEAHLLFMQSIIEHDSNRSQFITLLWNRLKWHFFDTIRQRVKDSKINFVSIQEITAEHADIDDFLPSHKSTPCFMVLIEQASEPVQTLWSLVNYPPPELIEDINNDDPAASWDALQRYLNYSMKWSWEQMHSAMKELREICST